MAETTYPLDLEGAALLDGWEGAVTGENDFLGAAETPDGNDGIRLWFRSDAARRRVFAEFARLARSAAAGAESATRDRGSLPGGIRFRNGSPEPPCDWTAPYRAFFRGVQAGGFFVHPPHVRAPPGLRSLLTTPGPAFGTGTHPTTRMLLESLADLLGSRRSRTRVLDVGTGSGILAVAAALLGARPVVGLDVDPVAIRCALETAGANQAADRIAFREGDYRDPEFAGALDTACPAGFDVILANLSAELLADFPAFAGARLRPGGRVLVSGFLREEAARILGAFPRAWARTAEIRLELPARAESEVWAAAALERRPPR